MKLFGVHVAYGAYPSPPARGRGLKLLLFVDESTWGGSPPARGRGLKLESRLEFSTLAEVAPRAGAWIETAS